MNTKSKNTIFTDKELQIVELRSRGFKSVDIAKKLEVSKADVSQTLRRLVRKIRIIESSFSLMRETCLIQESSKIKLTDFGAEIAGRSLHRQQRFKRECPKCGTTWFVRYRRGKTVCMNCGYIASPDKRADIDTQSSITEENVDVFRIDLRKIEGDGAFPCPKCRTLINPGDKSDKVYQVVEKIIEDGKLAELLLTCTKCKSKIKLVGFVEF
jgi:predicted transcriptional regulator/DNA-directed RNA polymerase subunit M/transcription elongation factor TFIIS